MPVTNRIRKSATAIKNGADSAGIWVDPVSGALKFNPDGSVRTVGGDIGKGINIFLDPANGSDHNSGLGPNDAKATLDGVQGAFSLAVAGRGDVIVLLSDGSTTATCRINAAFNWNKKNTHLIGVSSGSAFSGRARLSPDAATTAFGNFLTVSVDGCRFENISIYFGFTVSTAAEIALTITGNRNVFSNCHILSMGDGDTTALNGTTARHVKISGGGENLFENCVIGGDTLARTAANVSVEFAAGTPRNIFKSCTFPVFATNAGVLIVKGAAAACMDRFQLFDNCTFINSVKSGAGTAMTGVALLAASAGGLLYFRNCDNVGCGPWGSSDATTKAQIYVNGPLTANTAGIALTAVN